MMSSGGTRPGPGGCPVYSATEWRANSTEKQMALFREWESLCIGYLVSCKEGTNVRHVASQLEEQSGDEIPLSKMGLRSINDFLYLMQDYLDIRKLDVRYFVFIKEYMVPSQMQHIRDFVLQQHKSKGTKNRTGHIVRPTKGQTSHCSPDELLQVGQRYQGSNTFSSGSRASQPVQQVRRVSYYSSSGSTGSRSRSNVQSTSYKTQNSYSSYPTQPSRPGNPAPVVKRSPLLQVTHSTTPSASYLNRMLPPIQNEKRLTPTTGAFKKFVFGPPPAPTTTYGRPAGFSDSASDSEDSLKDLSIEPQKYLANASKPTTSSTILSGSDPDRPKNYLPVAAVPIPQVPVPQRPPPTPTPIVKRPPLLQVTHNDNTTPIDFDNLQCNLDTLDIFSAIQPKLSGPKPDRPSPAKDITFEDRLKVKAYPWPPFIVGEREKDVKSFLMKNKMEIPVNVIGLSQYH